MIYSKYDIEKLRQNADIRKVIPGADEFRPSSYVRCPSCGHEGKSKGLQVVHRGSAKNYAHCYACGFHLNDAIAAVMFYDYNNDKSKYPLPFEEGKKKIDKLGGYEKLYRIKFEADYLAKLAYEGARRIYGEPLSEEVDERIRFELHIMKTMGFPGYFLIVQDFINAARSELGVWVGPGRGSAAGSVESSQK